MVLHGQDCTCLVTCSTQARLARKTCHSAPVSYGGPNQQQQWQQQEGKEDRNIAAVSTAEAATVAGGSSSKKRLTVQGLRLPHQMQSSGLSAPVRPVVLLMSASTAEHGVHGSFPLRGQPSQCVFSSCAYCNVAVESSSIISCLLLER